VGSLCSHPGFLAKRELWFAWCTDGRKSKPDKLDGQIARDWAGDFMSSLSLLDSASCKNGHDGEVCACAFTPDASQVLTGGWDCHLRLWETKTGQSLASFVASAKPISACAISPDGRHLLSGCLEGLLARWDANTHRRISMFLAHGRPLSSIVFTPDAKAVVTSSWDSNLIIWDVTREFEGHTLSGHRDIVAGCRLIPDGQTILSWSYDGTLRIWSVARRSLVGKFAGHQDRVTTAGVSPDGRLAVSGSRDGSLKLWDIRAGKELASRDLSTEVRGCFFLRHAQALAVVDLEGRCTLHSVNDLEEQAELSTGLSVVCSEMAPAGNLIALGCNDGRLRFVEIGEFDRFPLIVTATKTTLKTSTRLQRLFGRSRAVQVYVSTCPVCRHRVQIPCADTVQGLSCPGCKRSLRLADMSPPAQERMLHPVAS
jgi:WD40 repeat protein